MRLILTMCACAAFAYGRPEPPSGYNNHPSPPSSGYGAPSGPSFGGHSDLGSAPGGQSNFGHSGNGEGYYSPGYISSSDSTVVSKHVYVHLTPPEIEEKHQKRPHVHVPPPQKHYKIIFIKAPTPPTPTAPEIPPIPQDEQRTLVYVLVKKPEEQPDIVIPPAPPTEPSKPEVYFIKYKAQKEDSHEYGSSGNHDAPQGSDSHSSFSSNGVSSQYGPPDARESY